MLHAAILLVCIKAAPHTGCVQQQLDDPTTHRAEAAGHGELQQLPCNRKKRTYMCGHMCSRTCQRLPALLAKPVCTSADAVFRGANCAWVAQLLHKPSARQRCKELQKLRVARHIRRQTARGRSEAPRRPGLTGGVAGGGSAGAGPGAPGGAEGTGTPLISINYQHYNAAGIEHGANNVHDRFGGSSIGPRS